MFFIFIFFYTLLGSNIRLPFYNQAHCELLEPCCCWCPLSFCVQVKPTETIYLPFVKLSELNNGSWIDNIGLEWSNIKRSFCDLYIFCFALYIYLNYDLHKIIFIKFHYLETLFDIGLLWVLSNSKVNLFPELRVAWITFQWIAHLLFCLIYRTQCETETFFVTLTNPREGQAINLIIRPCCADKNCTVRKTMFTRSSGYNLF